MNKKAKKQELIDKETYKTEELWAFFDKIKAYLSSVFAKYPSCAVDFILTINSVKILYFTLISLSIHKRIVLLSRRMST